MYSTDMHNVTKSVLSEQNEIVTSSECIHLKTVSTKGKAISQTIQI